MLENQLAISVLNIIALFLILYMAWNNEMLLPRNRRQIAVILLATILVITAECFTNIFDQLDARFALPNQIANLIGFVISPLIPMLMAIAFDPEYNKNMYWFFLAGGINAVFTITSPWTGAIFYVTEANEYFRGSFFWVYVVSYSVSTFALFYVVLKWLRIKYARKNLLLPLLLFTLGGTSIQLVFPHVHTTWLCATFSIAIFYAFLCENNNKRDLLTTLYNRQLYEYAVRYLTLSGSGIVVMVDVDRFKQINDTHGHPYGDYCLNRIGNHLRQAFEKLGKSYRIGGDEFCVICEKASQAEVDAATARLIAAMVVLRKKSPDFPTISFGSSPFSPETGGLEAAIEKADRNMYQHKKNRRSES